MNANISSYNRVIEHFGSSTNAATALDVSRPAVSNWKHRGIPALIAVKIEKMTDGKIRAVDLICKNKTPV